jgi:hypothetical protein
VPLEGKLGKTVMRKAKASDFKLDTSPAALKKFRVTIINWLSSLFCNQATLIVK